MKEREQAGCGVTTSYKCREQPLPLRPGSLVTGIWNNQQYRIVRMLGSGANGVVYYVTRQQDANTIHKRREQGFAMKVGADTVEFQSEINGLTSLEVDRRKHAVRAGRQYARPFLVEADDVEIEGKKYPYYIMRYVSGVTLSDYLTKHGLDWFGILGGKLLRRLSELHANGWIFSDLKAENVLVSAEGEVDLVDYGGITPVGGSIRQFTEWYDRGYWNGGLRSADIGYDLFSFAVLTVHLFQKEQLQHCVRKSLPQVRQQEDLMEIIRQCPKLKPYQKWLERAIYGGFKTTEEAVELWRQISRHVYRTVPRPAHPTPRWLKVSFATSLVLLLMLLVYLVVSGSIMDVIGLE